MPTSPQSPESIRAKELGLTFRGNHAALRDINFDIAPGEFISLVGPSGCGKSSLLRLLAGLLHPSSGELLIRRAVKGESARAGGAGFVFQDPRLLPWRTVAENICLPMQLAGVTRSIQTARLAECLRLIGLADADAAKFPRQLSGGMRMRVSLARALAVSPKLLLLDEPFGALDDLLRQRLHEELLRIWQEQNWTAVFVTHNVSEAVFLSQRVFVMSPRPGTILSEITVPFAYPRKSELRAEAEFARLTGVVSDHLRGVLV